MSQKGTTEKQVLSYYSRPSFWTTFLIPHFLICFLSSWLLISPLGSFMAFNWPHFWFLWLQDFYFLIDHNLDCWSSYTVSSCFIWLLIPLPLLVQPGMVPHYVFSNSKSWIRIGGRGASKSPVERVNSTLNIMITWFLSWPNISLGYHPSWILSSWGFGWGKSSHSPHSQGWRNNISLAD